jgi:DNA topoisomerase-1
VKDKILAADYFALDETGIRIGNKQYANENGTLVWTTLRRKHVSFENQEAEQAKVTRQLRMLKLTTSIRKLIKKSAELPGFEIFRYQDKVCEISAR